MSTQVSIFFDLRQCSPSQEAIVFYTVNRLSSGTEYNIFVFAEFNVNLLLVNHSWAIPNSWLIIGFKFERQSPEKSKQVSSAYIIACVLSSDLGRSLTYNEKKDGSYYRALGYSCLCVKWGTCIFIDCYRLRAKRLVTPEKNFAMFLEIYTLVILRHTERSFPRFLLRGSA